MAKDTPPPKNEKIFLTFKEAAAILRINPKTLYDWTLRRKKGRRIPVIRLGTQCSRIPRDEFFQWLKENTSV